jgi:hypothetical protein
MLGKAKCVQKKFDEIVGKDSIYNPYSHNIKTMTETNILCSPLTNTCSKVDRYVSVRSIETLGVLNEFGVDIFINISHIHHNVLRKNH